MTNNKLSPLTFAEVYVKTHNALLQSYIALCAELVEELKTMREKEERLRV